MRDPVILLAIETAGSGCSAAVLRGPEVLAAQRRALRHGHAEVLLPMIERVTAEAGLGARQLDAVAVATGPGGFTGIRVGLAAAHGIALAVGARLVGVSSFAAAAAKLVGEASRDHGALLVALDSRRADLYIQLFAAGSATPLADPAAILPERLADYVETAGAILGGQPLLVAGDAVDAAAAALDGRFRVSLATDSAPDALGVGVAALRQLATDRAPGPVRPLYLRPPDVTLPGRRAQSPAPAR